MNNYIFFKEIIILIKQKNFKSIFFSIDMFKKEDPIILQCQKLIPLQKP